MDTEKSHATTAGRVTSRRCPAAEKRQADAGRDWAATGCEPGHGQRLGQATVELRVEGIAASASRWPTGSTDPSQQADIGAPVEARRGSGWFSDRALDDGAGAPTDRTRVWSALPPQLHQSLAGQPGLELAATPAASGRARRRPDPRLAGAGLAPDQKKRGGAA